MTALNMVVQGEPSEGTEQIRAMSAQVHSCLAGAVSGRGVTLPTVRLVVTDAYEAALEAESSRLGVATEVAVASAQGSTAYGRTLRNEGWTSASIIVRLGECDLGTVAVAKAMSLVAHELSHVAYGACERFAAGKREELPMTFTGAETAALQAAEEFRVERLGHVVLESLGYFESEGKPMRLADFEERNYRAGLPSATARCAEEVHRLATEFAGRGAPTRTFWTKVLGELQAFLQLVGYAEANCIDHPPAFNGISSPGVDLLRPLWAPFVDHVGSSPLLPRTEDWMSDARTLQMIGGTGVARVLQAVGINVDENGRLGTPATITPSWSR